MENKEKVQELYAELQELNQNVKHFQSQLDAVTQQLLELAATSSSLEELNKIKVGKEIFVPLSSGIFVKAGIKDTSELLVNVGSNVIVKKDVISTKKLIQKQMEELKKIQNQMVADLEKMLSHASDLEQQLQSLVSQG